MTKVSRLFLRLIALLLLTLTVSLAGAQSARWSEQRAQQWYAKQPWLVGSNHSHVYSAQAAYVNSSHHQFAKLPGDGLRIVAHCPKMASLKLSKALHKITLFWRYSGIRNALIQ